jgi:hypothetical protein
MYSNTILTGETPRIINTNANDIPIYKRLNDTICNKIVCSVYCNTYGFGDYLRGTIVLAYYAKYFGINLKMSMNMGSIGNYLNDPEINIQPSPENIEKYIVRTCNPEEGLYDNLYLRFVKFMDSSEKILYIETNMLYNMKYPSQDIKEIINSCILFKPNYYDEAKQLFNLNKYNVLHVRVSDDCFTSNIHNNKVVNLFKEIQKLKLSRDTIIISNNYNLKKRINTAFGFHFIDKVSKHTAQSNDIDLEVIEYIILSKSSHTLCFTHYGHGSGFSQQCSVLNNIPYQITLLDM